MASISFNDASGVTGAAGVVTLTNDTTSISLGVGSRFADWTPFQRPIGPRVPALGTGVPYQFRFRTDYGASFSMTDIPNTNMTQMLRTQEWLLRGNAITVTTSDASARTYTAYLAPEGDIALTLQDKNLLLYSMSFVLINSAAAPMLCIYD
jgi:hypothetical protein